jgi:membrane protein DedA with SNARE-associated domain
MLRDWIDLLGGFYDRYGYALVFLGALGENTALFGLVLPGGTLALLGAFYARQGTLNLGAVIALAWAGTVLGYSADYLIGRHLFNRLAPTLCASRLGSRLRLAGRLRLARKVLWRHGGKAILISHAVGHLRSFVALTAGVTRMDYRRFLTFELPAALVWNVGFCLLGYVAAVELETLLQVIERAGWVVLAVLVALFVAWRLLRHRIPALHGRTRRRWKKRGTAG